MSKEEIEKISEFVGKVYVEGRTVKNTEVNGVTFVKKPFKIKMKETDK